MGVRVRIVLVVLLLIVVLALAVPFALSLADRRTAALANERDRQLEALAAAAAATDVPLQLSVDRYFDVYGEGLVVMDADGRIMAARGLDAADPEVAAANGLRVRRAAALLLAMLAVAVLAAMNVMGATLVAAGVVIVRTA